MDFAKVNRGEAVRTQSLVVSATLFSILIATFLLISLIFISSVYKAGDPVQDDTDSVDTSSQDADDKFDTNSVDDDSSIVPMIKTVDFQPVVDEWVSGVGGNKSIIIFDLENGSVAGVYNPDEPYNTASLYKLFVVYNGYEKLSNGEWTTDMPVARTGYTVLDCLDLAIRESNSTCAETLWSMIGRDELQATLENDYDANNTNLGGLVSDANDILKIMKIFYKHNTISDQNLVDRMKDSFLNQPITTYNWRQGLPSGFSRANVYNKVGWDYNPDGKYWNNYHDTAIIEFPEEDRHFVVVVMTNRVPYQQIRDFGSMIEDAFYNQ